MTLFYIYLLRKANHQYVAYGQTENFNKKHKSNQRLLAVQQVRLVDFWTYECLNRQEALDLEQKCKEIFSGIGISITGLKTDPLPWTRKKDLDGLLESLGLRSEVDPIVQQIGMSRTTALRRLQELGLNPTPSNLDIVRRAYDPKEAYKAIVDLDRLWQLLSRRGVHCFEDLE